MKNIPVSVLFLCLAITAVAQTPRISPASKFQEHKGSHLLRIAPRPGETFRYRIAVKTQVAIKNSDDLFNTPDMRKEDKAGELVTHYLSATVRSRRNDGTTDYQMRIDSTHVYAENNGVSHAYTSTSEKDYSDSEFGPRAVYTGKDFGIIVDSLGDIRDIYGFFEVTDYAYDRLPDSLQTSERHNALADDTYSSIEKLFNYVVAYLNVKSPETDTSYGSTQDEDYTVWGQVSFPVRNELRGSFDGYKELGGKQYAKFTESITLTPNERTVKEDPYSITLPEYSYSKKSTYYIDVASGMIAFSSWTKDEVFGLKIESDAPEKNGKSFATVQRKKVEGTIELLE